MFKSWFFKWPFASYHFTSRFPSPPVDPPAATGAGIIKSPSLVGSTSEII